MILEQSVSVNGSSYVGYFMMEASLHDEQESESELKCCSSTQSTHNYIGMFHYHNLCLAKISPALKCLVS